MSDSYTRVMVRSILGSWFVLLLGSSEAMAQTTELDVSDAQSVQNQSSTTQAVDSPPAISLAHTYLEGVVVADYWVSEKMDGVRAYWDGAQLWTRQGKRINPPPWFTEGFPAEPLDGELWLGRGQFEAVSGIVRRQHPIDADWAKVRFWVFDAPAQSGDFAVRQQALQLLQTRWQQNKPLNHAEPTLGLVAHQRLASHAALMTHLQNLVAQGGEGLMLRRHAAPYRAGRSDDLLKLKLYDDAEAVVVGYSVGKGKYQGMIGALWVQTPAGIRFRIGSGLSDAVRRNPPPIDAVITYRYRGLTNHGVPRFARLLRLYTP